MRTAVFFNIVSLFFIVAVAEENKDKFHDLVQVSHSQAGFTHWQQLVINPSNNQQFFVINKTGQMFLVDDMKSVFPVLDLSINQQEGQLPIKLTAIELHPNFALRDQPGYGAFYTAHLEALDKQSKTKRIQENSNELILKFDAVITEWQFNSINYQKVDLNSKREVLRIAVPNNSMTVQQMSFSPFTKSWNEGFGLLYIALNGQESRQEPLYSGVLLRINPAKFGLRSFTVPNNNPYVKNNEIKDEIFLLGAQNIKQFMWPNKSSDSLLLSHQYHGKSLLSIVSAMEDWRKEPPSKVIYHGDNPIEDALIYRGRYLPHLRNKLLLLTQVNQEWLVESLNIKSSVRAVMPVDNQPEPEWRFNPAQVVSESDVSFSHDFNDEILVLDKTVGAIFKLPQENVSKEVPAEASMTSTVSTEVSPDKNYILFVVIVAIGVILYFIKRNKISAKAVVRKQFAQIELSKSQHQIGLYHRHKNSPDTIIDIIDIVICEVMLNDMPVCEINKQVGHGFDNEKDQDLRAIFIKEKVDKMVDGKMRQVTLSFTDVHSKNYVICLYMRKGSDRVTKKRYTVVIDDLIDWCWLIASKINPEETQKRKEKPIVSSNPLKEATIQGREKISLHEQAAMNRLAAHPVADIQKSTEMKTAVEVPKAIAVDASNEAVVRENQKKSIDTELVDALEKLVDLKQQGFLTQDEFTKAKENLLNSLFDK